MVKASPSGHHLLMGREWEQFQEAGRLLQEGLLSSLCVCWVQDVLAVAGKAVGVK